MSLVENKNQIAQNIVELDLSRNPEHPFYGHYRELIKRGQCFVVYSKDGETLFAPSRFIGYTKNSIKKHIKRTEKDGRQTNAAIEKILCLSPTENQEMEHLYVDYCNRLGVKPKNTSKTPRKYWCFFEDEDLSFLAAECEILNSKKIEETEKDQLIKARRGQGVFRDSLIDFWRRKCSVTSCSYTAILRASHIKSWCKSDNDERLDKFNGLLLLPNLDALFDKGLISFDDDGLILISEELRERDRLSLGVDKNMKIAVHPKHRPYLQWHREEMFKNL